MKISKFLLALLVVIFINSSKIIAKTICSIQKAFDNKYIQAKAVCKGGLVLNYTIENFLKDSLQIIIPAGWRFNSNAGKNDYQDILITRDQILTLKAKQKKDFEIKGYCCEATKSGPIHGIPYTKGKQADKNLTQLAEFLNANPNDENTEQYSVWAISDQKETANITAKNDSLASIVRKFVSNLKGEPLPWYTLLKKSYVSSLGTVNDFPIKLKATINYAVTEHVYSYCYIIDSTGQKVSKILGKWLLPSETDYLVGLSVLGLKSGEYKLVLETNKAQLFEKSFKI